MDTLHSQIIERACRADGWQRGPWRPAFAAKCKEDSGWAGEIADGGLKELFGGIRRNPDAWRLVVEDENTPGQDWNYPVLVLEFLEVEIDHPMPLDKRRDYVRLWWLFDGSSSFHLRIYHAGRYGQPQIWLDTHSIYEETSLG